MELLENEQIEEMFEYLTVYKDSLTDDTEIEKAETPIRYLTANKEGLLPYQKRGLTLLSPLWQPGELTPMEFIRGIRLLL